MSDMIPVRKVARVDPETGEIAHGHQIERLKGNPTLLRLDHAQKAPLQTVLAPSWTTAQRAAYGVYLAKPLEIPDGMELSGEPWFEETAEGIEERGTLVPRIRPPDADMRRAVLAFAEKSFGLSADEVRGLLQ